MRWSMDERTGRTVITTDVTRSALVPSWRLQALLGLGPNALNGGNLLKEFRDFISRGNLIDLAVAFVLGIAFAGVITSLTEGIVTPLIGRIFQVDNLQTYVIAGDI